MAKAPELRFEWKRAALPAAGFAFVAALIVLVRHTAAQGQDFSVAWQIARYVFIEGQPAYDVVRDGAMSFKYPPWILPFLAPLVFLPLQAAKWCWGTVCVLSLLYIVRETGRRSGIAGVRLALVTAVFWGLWAVHALDGQITLPILAIAFWATSRREPWAQAIVLWAMSTKIFTLIGAAGAQPRGSLRTKCIRIIWAIGVFAALSLPALVVSPGKSVTSLIQTWTATASSGGRLFEGDKIRGRDNQGLPALVLRATQTPASDTRADIAAFMGLGLVIGGAWAWFSRGLGRMETWSGWLALAAALHPLAWFHSFVLAFPLAALAVDRAWRSSKIQLRFFAVLGLACLALVTRKTLGPVGETLELVSIKSWGVLVLLMVVFMTSAKEPAR